MLLDILFAAIIIVSVIVGRKKGVVRMAMSISSTMLSAVASVFLYRPFIEMVSTNEILSGWIDSAKNGIKNAVMPTLNLEETANGSEKIPTVVKVLADEKVIEQGENAIAGAVADMVIEIATLLAFLIIIRIVIGMLLKTTNIVAKLPVIKQANGLLGGILGLVVGVLICYIAAAVLVIFAASGSLIAENEQSSLLAEHFFRNNIIISLIK